MAQLTYQQQLDLNAACDATVAHEQIVNTARNYIEHLWQIQRFRYLDRESGLKHLQTEHKWLARQYTEHLNIRSTLLDAERLRSMAEYGLEINTAHILPSIKLLDTFMRSCEMLMRMTTDAMEQLEDNEIQLFFETGEKNTYGIHAEDLYSMWCDNPSFATLRWLSCITTYTRRQCVNQLKNIRRLKCQNQSINS